ncbi:TonB-dependent receptor [Thermomonas carbonis]|uniref:TonB-dependent receptor n=1 Tax=Thermomonas carbonis TaxID=1463158 RepID=A0A7G9SMD6_9GAMM|nr:TonB-dependent receptor [Thermomonas carbonis]QNN69011.1 TonB-dependent receptor [Thermomonas carbonis]GHC07337.1 TonB-dependent receptor [Thermomonas carbonis]
MHASKRNSRKTVLPSPHRRLPLAVAIAMVMCAPQAWAQDAAPEGQEKDARTLDTVTVTAQKREENLQKVPISLQVLGNTQLEQQNVSDFDDYAKLIPSLTYGTAGGGVFSGPGFVQVYMRGIASGGDGNHSGSQPSAGMYLDDQPITTIQGALDIHMYDIERVEALAGPQGTLYGASSQSGTVRIITRKPDSSAFSAGYSVEANGIDGGGFGHVLEGFVNIPISDRAAVRLVGWQKHDAGYVDNIRGTRTYPTSGITDDNADLAEDDYNTADTMGLRGALRFDINDNWTITPQLIAQKQKAYGSAGIDPNTGNPDMGYDASSGDMAVKHFFPESSNDRWHQAALTVEGKIGNFDLTYVFSQLKRDVDSESDYSDYGFWYDTLAGYGAYFYDDNGDYINPAQYIQATDGYKRTSHELRVSSPQENRFRMVAGLFWQQQSHDIFQRYKVDNLTQDFWVNGWEDTIWLTAQQRKDRDEAVFGELSFDITDAITVTGGMRWFKANNSLKGFFGYGDGFSGSTGVSQCFSNEAFNGAPCTNLDKRVSERDSLGKVNLTWQIDDNKMIYATWSEGYRPGGINRRGTLPPYTSDFLTNYELGWKTTWGNAFVFNGALFRADWEDFQFSYLGQNGLTEIRNANSAQVDGLELDLSWAASYNLQISGGFAWYDAKLTRNYCGWIRPDGEPETVCPPGTLNPNGDPVDGPQAASGTRLPITPKFKGALNARYTWDLAGGEAYWQASASHVGNRRVDLREAETALLGTLAAYTTADVSVGWSKDNWSIDLFLKNAFDERAEMSRFAQCAALTCGNQPYTVIAQPRTFGIRFSQSF